MSWLALLAPFWRPIAAFLGGVAAFLGGKAAQRREQDLEDAEDYRDTTRRMDDAVRGARGEPADEWLRRFKERQRSGDA